MEASQLSRLDKDQFRQIVRAHLQSRSQDTRTLIEGDHVLNPGFYRKVAERALKPAAVLVPVVERADGLHMIFTKRTQKLKSHSGQISFPGGRIDSTDATPMAAALRETWEEIGVRQGDIEVLGQMPDYHTGSGYHISSIVGLVNSQAAFEANPDEVDYIFEVPLAFLMEPSNHRLGSRVFENVERYYYEMPWKEHFIWGVTAGIVRVFYDRVFK